MGTTFSPPRTYSEPFGSAKSFCTSTTTSAVWRSNGGTLLLSGCGRLELVGHIRGQERVEAVAAPWAEEEARDLVLAVDLGVTDQVGVGFGATSGTCHRATP